MENKKYVYLFSEGNAKMRNLLGGKGANLAEMTRLGIPVPQGFTVSTDACLKYYKNGEKISEDIIEQINNSIEDLEKITGKHFGISDNPLLLSVRSGARVSMPGMMDTILNLGLNDVTVEKIAALTKNPRFAYDSYRRFIQMFSDVVMGIEKRKFEDLIDKAKGEKEVKYDIELDENDLKKLALGFKKLYEREIGKPFPDNPKEQLIESITAVFRSWNNPRAIVYRRLNDIPGEWGTAVNVQAMVFGNMGSNSGTGVAFTRNPATGENKIFGEYLINAQGEDVVAGIRTPEPIAKLKEDLPECYEEFINTAHRLENHYRDMQDMEFTIEQGKLYFLQTRNGKRTAQSALKIAVDMVNERAITKEQAILKVEPRQLETLLHPAFDAEDIKKAKVIAKGLPASPGAACGKVYFTAEEAKKHHEKGEKVILVRLETSPEDIEGMVAAEGILTIRGGMTSHAAVVARGMGTCCVAGCGSISIDEEKKVFKVQGKEYIEGDYISLDGSTGNVYGGAVKTTLPAVSGNFEIFMKWADGIKKLQVRTNADTPKDAKEAIKFGAKGIGLCRTEHMFFEVDRIPAVREMIVASTVEQRKRALDKLLPMQREDFIGIYEAMEGNPVTVRFLDPPLHEFLPSEEMDIENLSKEMNIDLQDLKATITSLHEFNPMMGHRGCRLSVSYPEIAEMQTRAVIEAALYVNKTKKLNIIPEIMIPLVGEIKELKFVKDIVVKTAEEIINKSGEELKYQVGTMIEIPRAALTADEIAKEAEFFSFGTNDLTQMTFGFSRDDAGKFLSYYYDNKIYEFDPFEKLDQIGVGKLIKMAVELGKKTRPDIHLGICGEHGGDPSSVEFCHNVGLDYVSCSPFRVPLARLAAAQAQVKNPR
ncbi:pyruvate, phosphate dikinase [Clostridium pasteurianum DSM 525 = ATCC 6013]|uniref:Pyruvate, phosphate dikinase n=1 Tax=Clostridium pasteurianum DSM 525 = ATCC 6013 TaxID=1262449 RepID=A0A0H3J8R3_CLOPA|nr:pyruvate, phosphate dikinase [Clostridium pasteurianum]AJA48363.1 pyruvate, phosphate dikinase [Clostridium pasteurianum DSM 525 = ATCC 6013]AJA52351.1 pyruvate, phosphate dikinase [Clostridium pasteurianum DSM 525 = ATCC 6013]AOZ75609.1 pyruvate phosphate dikinase [Clostridium pasteurianum DSM 525 = ATCC 6013]AOZ79405.1 pyruvate phosphate dikinase [Clostridium pasteurianum]ELP60487.1 pyruvate phosphate dikinase [Clostridium pasteurianum DSM 525 = ATCC 6013]